MANFVIRGWMSHKTTLISSLTFILCALSLMWRRTKSHICRVCCGRKIRKAWSDSMWHPLFPDQTIFDFPTSIFNHFRKKIVSAQRNIHSIHILYTVPPKRDFVERNFCLCVENVMRVLDPFFFISSRFRSVFLHIKPWLLFTYKVSDVMFYQKRFALKITLKC